MGVFSALNWWYLWDQNRKKSVVRLEKMKMGMEKGREEEYLRLGDRSVWFEYNL